MELLNIFTINVSFAHLMLHMYVSLCASLCDVGRVITQSLGAGVD